MLLLSFLCHCLRDQPLMQAVLHNGRPLFFVMVVWSSRLAHGQVSLHVILHQERHDPPAGVEDLDQEIVGMQAQGVAMQMIKSIRGGDHASF